MEQQSGQYTLNKPWTDPSATPFIRIQNVTKNFGAFTAVDNAHKFLDFIMRPDIIAEISNYVYYANGNSASFDLIDKDVTEDPAIYPPEAVKSKLTASAVRSARYERSQTRAWTKIKTGQ